MTTSPAVYEGPFDREPWPERLPATVVDPRGEPRIHGYEVRRDLARHHGIADLAWLAARGELPTATEREAFEVAVIWLAPVHAGEAASHAGILAKLVGALPSAVISTIATGLAELGRTERDALAPWLSWLDAPIGAPPPCAVEAAPDADAADAHAWLVERTAVWFGPDAALPESPVLGRVAGGHALLHRLGLRDPQLVEGVVTWARLLIVIAETASLRAGAVRDYPARLPDYQYVDDQGGSP
ncbi:MAG: hypothetical protein ABJE95_20780 [Byssovorax sp.]